MSENSIIDAIKLAQNIYYTPFTVMGYDPTCTNSASGQIIYDDNASTYNLSFATDDEDIAITSSSDSDTQSITINGINKLLQPVSLTTTLTGYTPVLPTTKFYRINEIINNTSVAFAGKIYICKYPYADGGGVTNGVPSATDFQTNVRLANSIGFNRNTQSVYTVPSGYRAYVSRISGNCSAGIVTIILRSKLHTSTAWDTERTISVNASGNTTFNDELPIALVFDAGYDLSLIYIAGTANAKIFGTIDLLLEKI